MWRVAAGRRARDVAMADPRGIQVDRGRHLLPMLFLSGSKTCSKEAIVEGGRLIDLPSHLRLLLLCDSHCHNNLLVLDNGDVVEGIRGSSG